MSYAETTERQLFAKSFRQINISFLPDTSLHRFFLDTRNGQTELLVEKGRSVSLQIPNKPILTGDLEQIEGSQQLMAYLYDETNQQLCATLCGYPEALTLTIIGEKHQFSTLDPKNKTGINRQRERLEEVVIPA